MATTNLLYYCLGLNIFLVPMIQEYFNFSPLKGTKKIQTIFSKIVI